MNLSYPPEIGELRFEVRAWLDENLEDRFRDLAGVLELTADDLATHREWLARLAGAGYAPIPWPKKYGGSGLGLLEQVVITEELHRARAPMHPNALGLANIAPAILHWGTEEQKRRYLRPMARAKKLWCQGFSEPDAGSDLASLRTSAVLDGDEFVVTGQKVWTTMGHLADWCELLVRTDPGESRHRGISCLLVDLHLPGVGVRPLRTITGESEFNELWFDEVRVPGDALLGPLHEGWQVAMTTLAHERMGVVHLHLQVRRRIDELIELARKRVVHRGWYGVTHPALQRELARLYRDGELLRLLAQRAVSAGLNGREPGAESSVAKLHWSELEQRLQEVAAEILERDANVGVWGSERLRARAYTIAGGTTQVNKNIIAEHILGLPRPT